MGMSSEAGHPEPSDPRVSAPLAAPSALSSALQSQAAAAPVGPAHVATASVGQPHHELGRLCLGLMLGSGTGLFLNFNMMVCWGFGLAYVLASVACTGLLLGLVVHKTGWGYSAGLALVELVFLLVCALWGVLSGV
jgi:hypothetical protein